MFSKAEAGVMRNPLPVSLCGRREEGGWRWPGDGGKSLRGRRHSATLSY